MDERHSPRSLPGSWGLPVIATVARILCRDPPCRIIFYKELSIAVRANAHGHQN